MAASIELNLIGLDLFKKKLGKRFYGEVYVRRNPIADPRKVELILEVKGSISFALAVKHFRLDVLSNVHDNAEFLAVCLFELQKLNQETIDITELSLLMTDTAIFIQKVSDFSIVNQLDNVMRVLMNHYYNLVSHMTEVPAEIHIPVMENAEVKNETLPILSDFVNSSNECDYFMYWGLYYDSLNEAVIYDLEKSNFIFEEPSYLNG